MATLLDYKVWLQEVDLEPTDYEAASQLAHSLRNRCECGLFKTVVAKGVNNGWVIYAEGVADCLKLTTAKQMTAFIRHIEATICEDMDAEIYASYKHAMLRDD